jgi:hypothetical protein
MADSLLQSNQDLEELGQQLYPDSLLSAGPVKGSPTLVELFLALHKITGKDRYRKAVVTLKSKFFSQEPGTLQLLGLDDDGANLDAMLAEAQAAVSLKDSGYTVKGLPCYFDALLSRIYLNQSGSDSEFNPVGGIKYTLGDRSLVFRGYEFSHTLLTLNDHMNKSSRLKELNRLITQLLGFTRQKPLGTSYFDPTQKPGNRFAAPSSSVWMRELYYMGRLFEEFPDAVSI